MQQQSGPVRQSALSVMRVPSQQQAAQRAAAQPRAPSERKKKRNPTGKARKQYTITKPRESWTPEEHEQFLKAIKLYERDWKRIGECITTKSVIQIRSHAQKYFIKMKKAGLHHEIPPSRPKRKIDRMGPVAAAAGPGGKKAKTGDAKPKKAPAPRRRKVAKQQQKQQLQLLQTPESGYPGQGADLPMSPMGSLVSAANQPLEWGLLDRERLVGLAPNEASAARRHIQQAVQDYVHNNRYGANAEQHPRPFGSPPLSSSSSSSSSQNDPGPHFSKVYAFLSNLFDPNMDDHRQEWHDLGEAEKEMVQVLMQNLMFNLKTEDDNGQPGNDDTRDGPGDGSRSAHNYSRSLVSEQNGVILEDIRLPVGHNSAVLGNLHPGSHPFPSPAMTGMVQDQPIIDITSASPRTLARNYQISPRAVSPALALGQLAASELVLDEVPPKRKIPLRDLKKEQ
jgi:SHAQKYF class myb-like DNA-binding protein